MMQPKKAITSDLASEGFLAHLAADELLRVEKVPNVNTVLVLFSTRAMAYDRASLQQKIQLTYPGSAVFFMTTFGIPVGAPPPEAIDLLIDFTGPGQKHKRLLARKLRSRSRVAVGRDAGFFRAFIYDRVYDEAKDQMPEELLVRERLVQRNVLRLAGIPLSQKGELLPDVHRRITEVNAAVRKH